MRALVQRVNSASVNVDGQCVGSIGRGLLVFLGVGREDEESLIPILGKKISEMRIFEDGCGKLNLSLLDLKADILIVSQFTLYANCSRGRRPDFTQAADPDKARELYLKMIEYFSSLGLNTQTGIFAADMKVSLVNDGPVTFFLEYKL
ncbi:MAG: D-aminoacyl-tRNA deacylase [Candidatus Cloacimonadaceae bacterium]|nr:D-aminoacyl-tRNA deacylase [Candidatus Cloacimonadaceae bacterium]